MENLSLFDEQQTMENLDGVKDSNHLDVVKLHILRESALYVSCWTISSRQKSSLDAKMLWITLCRALWHTSAS